MNLHKIQKNKRGFVLLFAVTLAAILLAMAIGVTNIALREVKFSTSAKDTNDAFFAADTGVEYVLYNDKSTVNAYPAPAPGSSPPQTWSVTLPNLNGVNGSCAIVSITKNNITSPMRTTIVSKGYNVGNASCGPSNPNRIEREIRVTY